MDEHQKTEAITAARREIARRIARVCASLSPEEFDRLVDRMAGIQWKYEVFRSTSESRLPTAVRSPNRTRDGTPPS